LPDRFFHPSLDRQDSVSLEAAEAHHLIHVMRAAPGTEVVLFDGSGAEFLARVERIERSAVRLAIVQRREVDRELPCDLTLGVALPKGDRQRWLIEKATELGVTRVVPLITTRGVAQPTVEALRRLKRAVIEASKQCGRNRLMQIDEPRAWDGFIQDTRSGGKETNQSIARLVAHPGGVSLADCRCDVSKTVTFVVAVGPEGGLTEEECRRAADAGWQLVNLGPRILRVETAAIALIAAITAKLPC
jgi:16S rRNA (uracil1498-N3)-methyltransferase